ncbi:MAG TPA: hypothetical protein VGM68_12575 [Rhizomicrobium sp.]|jgi:hypothetical protein
MMKILRRRLDHAIALAACLSMTTPALAQMNSMILAGPQNNAMGQVMALRAKQMQQQFDRNASSQAKSESSSRQSLASQNLAIEFNPAVTKQVHDLYIDGLKQSGGATQASLVDQRLGNIRASFARMVSPYGLRADDLSDVMAAHMIVMWMAANQQSGLPTPAQAQAVRRQMQNVFASRTGAISMPAERQSTAEYVMYETCMTLLVRGELGSRPDLDKRVSDAVNIKMTGQGYSLRDLRLTDEGLVKN